MTNKNFNIEDIRIKIRKIMKLLEEHKTNNNEIDRDRIISAKNNLGDATADLYDITNKNQNKK